jgi:ribonuclease HI
MTLLKEGVQWGIGNGNKTKILVDKWIPGVPPCTLRPLVPLLPDQTVDTLMLDDRREWDGDLVRTIFDDEMAGKILQVPISRFGGEDFASWPWTRYGHYSVRSAYHLARSAKVAMDRSKRGQGSSSIVEDNSRIWKKLWAAKAPGKMKITLWRFAHDCLPCGHQLQKRHVPAQPSCIYCNKYETIEHALLFCPYAKEVWKEIKSGHMIHLNRRAFTSPRVWTLDFIDKCTDLEASILMVSMWHIWDARNKLREGDGMLHPASLAARINAYIDLICQHLYKPKPFYRREPSVTQKWVPPPMGSVLVNVDAAVFASSRRMGAGIVVRDHAGLFITACGDSQQEVTSPEMAEALALRRAVSFAVNEGFTKVIFASDCLSVINRIAEPLVDRSFCGPVIEDVKLAAASFESCSFTHVSRSLNMAAHCLARLCEFSVDAVWRGVPPDCIREAICNDIMIM